MGGAHGVATAGVILIGTGARLQQVVGLVVEAAVAVSGTGVLCLAGVVVDHVQPHLDTGLVESVHHVLELSGGIGIAGRIRGSADCCVGGVGREEVQCHVAPVVAFLGIVLLNGE